MNANNNNHTNGNKTNEQLFSEVPAFWNTKHLTPEGFECQITLRAETGSELLEKAAVVCLSYGSKSLSAGRVETWLFPPWINCACCSSG